MIDRQSLAFYQHDQPEPVWGGRGQGPDYQRLPAPSPVAPPSADLGGGGPRGNQGLQQAYLKMKEELESELASEG